VGTKNVQKAHPPSNLPPVLLPDGGWWGTLAAARDLGSRGVSVTLASEQRIIPGRFSRYVHRTVISPSSGEPERFLSWLLDFGASNPGCVLYPTSDNVAWIVSSHQELLAKHFYLYSPRLSSLAALLDKVQLSDNARDAGLDVPDIRLPVNTEELKACGRELGMPIFIKPRTHLFKVPMGKGVQVKQFDDLVQAWNRECSMAEFHPEIVDEIPNISLPIVQPFINNSERVYTVNGFIDESGEIDVGIASVKVLQRPRGLGAGIIFENAELDDSVYKGLLKLLRAVQYCGVFDAEFMEIDGRKLLIDINPRIYNHIAFEIERGVPLPWIAYAAACELIEKPGEIIRNNSLITRQQRTYVHRVPSRLLFLFQTLSGAMSRNEVRRLRNMIASYDGRVTNPAKATDDPWPEVAEILVEALAFIAHPRAYIRALLKRP